MTYSSRVASADVGLCDRLTMKGISDKIPKKSRLVILHSLQQKIEIVLSNRKPVVPTKLEGLMLRPAAGVISPVRIVYTVEAKAKFL